MINIYLKNIPNMTILVQKIPNMTKNYAKREEARVGCGRGHVRETRPSNKKMGNLARDALVRSQTPL